MRAPLPEPPLLVSVSWTPSTPEVDVTVRGACDAGAKVTVVGAEEFAAYVPSLAWSTSTVQVPTVGAVTVVPLSVSEQSAVPVVSTA